MSLLAGSQAGLRAAGDRELTLNTRLDTGDAFGTALALADFDGDGTADLAAGARHDSVQGHTGAGAVSVFYGSRAGLRISGEQLWTRGTRGIRGAVGEDAFGVALAP